MNISDIAIREVVSADKSATVLEVAKLMRENHVGDVVIVEMSDKGEVPIGIITDRDIVIEVIAAEIELGDISVGDAMSYELVSAHEKDSLEKVIGIMRDKKVRRIPIVNGDGVLSGIICADDIFLVLSTLYDQLSVAYGIKQ